MCIKLACLQTAHMSVQYGNAYSMHVDMLILGTTLSMNICARLTFFLCVHLVYNKSMLEWIPKSPVSVNGFWVGRRWGGIRRCQTHSDIFSPACSTIGSTIIGSTTCHIDASFSLPSSTINLCPVERSNINLLIP